MSRPAEIVHPVSLARAAGIDAAVLLFGTAAALVSFLMGNGEPRWHNLVFAPVVFVLAAITMRLVLAEVRALVPVLPETSHKGEAIAALMVAIVMTVVVAPMLLIVPFVFFGSI
jgi:membrane-bound metal-dependent hydrolase YbcI (DUF457 family)